MMIKWAFNFRAWQPTRSEWMFCGQCIQNEEKDRIQRFVFKKDAKAAMVGQIIIEDSIYIYSPFQFVFNFLLMEFLFDHKISQQKPNPYSKFY